MAPKKNAFFFFMLEVQRQEQEKGVTCTRAAAQNLADPKWKNMSTTARKKYVEMANKHNGNRDSDLSKKFTTTGVSFAMVDAQERQREESQNVMISYIKRTVSELKKTDQLKDEKFFVCHVNYYYVTDDNYYTPAEFALGVFSFTEGIIDVLHFFIHPGQVIKGYGYAAIEQTDRIHKISHLDPPKESYQDWGTIFNKVQAFMVKYSSEDMLPPIYTMCDSINHNFSHSTVETAFNYMCDAKLFDISLFRIYHLDRLFLEVKQSYATAETARFLSVALLRNEIEKDMFSYAQGLGCYYHEKIEYPLYCSLSMVNRWIFTMCDHVCKDMRVLLKLGYHVPKDVDVNWQRKSKQHIAQEDITTSMKTLSIITEDSQKPPKKPAAEAVRQPKMLYNPKMAANFDSQPSSSGQLNAAADDDDEWTHVVSHKGGGMGKGRGGARPKIKSNLPVSGRGKYL